MKQLFLSLFGLVLFTVSCGEIGKECDEEKYASAIVYDFPDSLQAGVSHLLKIAYIIENSCGSFVMFEEKMSSGMVTEVSVKLLYEGCNCNLEFEEDSNYYELKQDSSGTYIYKFYQGDADYDSYTLHVYD